MEIKTLMRILLILLLLVLPVNATADEWTKTDTAMQSIYTGLHLVDWSQTLKIREKNVTVVETGMNSDWKYVWSEEKNSLLGKNPSRGKINRYFIITGLGHWWVSDILGDVELFNIDWRKVWQGFGIYTEYNVVTHNKRNGFKYSVSF
jgi:hypothetical protein